ncbi:MAG: HupE/UreJ family protein [Haliscomenobacter sp.]|nr:HupE/UreJ family protein [Haliscomenobacter sp.]MBK8879282.1 HupE/UreJ family protein [Haliscomenobacter sp.]
MQSLFQTYLTLGFEHIADLKGYDHILFIIALCAIYKLSEWRKVVILATAFTLGHSATLALAALDIIPINAEWIEFLIPVTILATALYNVVVHRFSREMDEGTFDRRMNLNYFFAAGFGLIHGMGFSNFFRAMVMPGEHAQLVKQLFAFNIGVEVGQLLIIACVLAASYIAFNLGKIKQREWNLFISGGAAANALVIALERWPG